MSPILCCTFHPIQCINRNQGCEQTFVHLDSIQHLAVKYDSQIYCHSADREQFSHYSLSLCAFGTHVLPQHSACVPFTMHTTTTENVRITVLPPHSCGGTLQSLYLKLLHSSMQTSAGGLNGQRQVSHMTDEKGEIWSPSKMSEAHQTAHQHKEGHILSSWAALTC